MSRRRVESKDFEDNGLHTRLAILPERLEAFFRRIPPESDRDIVQRVVVATVDVGYRHRNNSPQGFVGRENEVQGVGILIMVDDPPVDVSEYSAQGIVLAHHGGIFDLGVFPPLVDDVRDIDDVVTTEGVEICVEEGREDNGKCDALDERGKLDARMNRHELVYGRFGDQRHLPPPLVPFTRASDERLGLCGEGLVYLRITADKCTCQLKGMNEPFVRSRTGEEEAP